MSRRGATKADDADEENLLGRPAGNTSGKRNKSNNNKTWVDYTTIILLALIVVALVGILIVVIVLLAKTNAVLESTTQELNEHQVLPNLYQMQGMMQKMLRDPIGYVVGDDNPNPDRRRKDYSKLLKTAMDAGETLEFMKKHRMLESTLEVIQMMKQLTTRFGGFMTPPSSTSSSSTSSSTTDETSDQPSTP